MFERFTDAARAVVVDAQEQARRLQHPEVLAEHLLLAVLADGAGTGARVLHDHGLRRDRLVEEVTALGSADRDALGEIGIDLAQVRHRVEAVFGAGALDRPRPRRVGLLRRRVVVDCSRRRFSDAAKRALEQSLRQAVALGQHSIGAEHVLLGVLAQDDDPAARTLRRLGVSPADVRAEVRAWLGRAA